MKKFIDIVFDGSPVHFSVECEDNKLRVGDFALFESSRGVEIGKVVKPVFEAEEKVDSKDGEILEFEKIRYLKPATTLDIQTAKSNKLEAEKIKETTKQKIKEFELEMKIDEVFLSLDKSKITIYFTSDGRVDFRNLVKDLATTFKSRIELKQIGPRDEVRCMGGFGPCGKVCCCKEFLNDFDHVTIKMAKTQNLSLNPTKISGLCGRLMCCLAYENEHYAETASLMPKINSEVITPNGKGVVVFNDLLKRQITVKLGDENQTELKIFDLNDVKKIAR